MIAWFQLSLTEWVGVAALLLSALNAGWNVFLWKSSRAIKLRVELTYRVGASSRKLQSLGIRIVNNSARDVRIDSIHLQQGDHLVSLKQAALKKGVARLLDVIEADDAVVGRVSLGHLETFDLKQQQPLRARVTLASGERIWSQPFVIDPQEDEEVEGL